MEQPESDGTDKTQEDKNHKYVKEQNVPIRQKTIQAVGDVSIQDPNLVDQSEKSFQAS